MVCLCEVLVSVLMSDEFEGNHLGYKLLKGKSYLKIMLPYGCHSGGGISK